MQILELKQIVMENLELVIGSALSLFQYPVKQVLQFCSRNWILNVWDFVLSIGGRIHLERAWVLEAQQVNYVFLMDQFTSHIHHFSPKTLKHLNACQIFLHVLTLADITDGSGSHILKCSLQGKRNLDRRSSYRWPQQVCPSPAAWNIWHKSLSLPFCCTCTSNKLRKQLRRWHDTGPIHQVWTYFVDLSSQCLLHIPEGKSIFRCYLPAHSSRVFHPKGTVTFSHPVTILPVTVAHQIDSLITITARPLHSHGYTHQPYCTSLIHRPITSSLPHHLGILPQALRSAMRHCFLPTNISNLVAEYNNHTLVIVSNGSVINNDATHAWILYGTHTKTRAYSHGFVPGGGQVLSSLQAEIGGFDRGM